MPNKSSPSPFRKTAGLLPVILLLLFLRVGVVGAVPWYFMPTFGHDVRWVQGVAEVVLATALNHYNNHDNHIYLHDYHDFLNFIQD